VTPQELEQELADRPPRPAYLVAGEEALLREEAFASLRETVLAGADADFNLDRLEGDATTPAQLRDAIGALPVFAKRRLVWLREPGAARGKARELTSALPEILAELGDDGTTVLVVTSGSLDRRQAWVKAFANPAAIVDCAPPRDRRRLLGFVRDEAKRLGVRMERGAGEALLERVGPHLQMLRNELEKVVLLAAPETRIDAGWVAQAAADVAEEPIWDLTDAIGEGRSADALQILGKLLHAGAPPPVVLGALAQHLRRLAKVRDGARVPGAPFVVRKLEQQAARYSPARLRAGLRAIHTSDEMLKGASPAAPEWVLERLVLGLSG